MTRGLTTRSDPTDLTSRAFQLHFASINEDTRSVEAVIATESPVMVYDWNKRDMVHEVLRMDGIVIPDNRQLPLLDSHDRSSVSKIVGSCRDLRIEDGKLIGRNYFAKSAEAEHAWNLIREKHLTDNSIGYRVAESSIVDKGQTATIKGRAYTAPSDYAVRVTTRWHVVENSLCPIGADSKAKNREQTASATEPNADNPYRKEYEMNFQEWLKARGLEHDKMTEDQRAVLKVAFENEGKTQKREDASDDNQNQDQDQIHLEQLRVEEKKRTDSIRVEGRAFAGRIPDAMVDQAIRDGLTVAEFRDKMLAHLRKQNPAKPANLSGGSGEYRTESYSDALLMRAGLEDVVVKGPNGPQRAEVADKIRSVSLYDVCYRALEMEGRIVPVDRNEAIRAAFSTASLTTILSNVANKAMLRGYNAYEQTWRAWCNVGTASDYKTMTRVRLTDVGDLKETPVDGEVKHGSAVDEAEEFVIARYAKLFSIDEITIKNDDLSALARVPQALGSRASALISKLVYTHLLANGNMSDSAALFVAGHSNLNTTCALSATNLSTAMTSFLNQTDKDGQPIDVMPKILLVPPGLWETARVLTESDLVVIAGPMTAAATATKAGNINAFRGLLKAVVEPRLANSSYTGYSATSWYLIGDPAVCDTIEVAFLDGVQAPVLERFESDQSRFGITWRVRIDAGCKALDYRTMSLNQA